MQTTNGNDLSIGLLAAAPAPGCADKMHPFDLLVGDWNLEIVDIAADGTQNTFTGVWKFRWGLGGRAIIDVWTVTGREQGVTVRFFDTTIGAWRSTWIAPQGERVMPFIGRYVDREIVLENTGEDGVLNSWIFSDIAEDTFRWRGEISSDGGATWRVEQRMFARRAAP